MSLSKEFLQGVMAIGDRKDLHEAYAALKEQEHEIRRKALYEARTTFKIGDIVVCESNRRGGALHGTLEAFSRTSATMRACRTTEMLFNGTPRVWRVPPDMLRPATAQEKENWQKFMKQRRPDGIRLPSLELPPLETVDLLPADTAASGPDPKLRRKKKR